MIEKINFGPIGEALKVFDTDLMDIARKLEIQNPDGTTGETSSDVPLYEKVPCHVSFVSADNPDAKTTGDTKPKIVGLKINCPLEVDLQNGDYITAYKMSADNKVLETYIGVIGEPSVDQARKSALMSMRTDV